MLSISASLRDPLCPDAIIPYTHGYCCIIFFLNLFIHFWLCCVFVSVWGPPPVAASGGHSSSRCAGLSLSQPLFAEHRLQTCRPSRCGSRVQLLRGMRDPTGPGLEPASPASAGRLSTTAPPGKPCCIIFNKSRSSHLSPTFPHIFFFFQSFIKINSSFPPPFTLSHSSYILLLVLSFKKVPKRMEEWLLIDYGIVICVCACVHICVCVCTSICVSLCLCLCLPLCIWGSWYKLAVSFH